MTRNYGVLVLLAIVLIGVTGCPTSDNNSNPTLTEISAHYTGTENIYTDTPLDDLKSDLTVTATYSNNTSNILSATDYTLSGTLTEGISTITVTYRDKTTTFDVTVSARNPTESPSMQVYNSDKTTEYDGEDLDFYIQDDTEKKVTATIKGGKLVITYSPLPESCSLSNVGEANQTLFSSATQISTNSLKYFEIILISSDSTKRLRYFSIESQDSQIRIVYFNENATFVSGGSSTTYDYTVKQGWNFVLRGAWTDPEHFKENYLWVVTQS
jgi:hypothetical protein